MRRLNSHKVRRKHTISKETLTTYQESQEVCASNQRLIRERKAPKEGPDYDNLELLSLKTLGENLSIYLQTSNLTISLMYEQAYNKDHNMAMAQRPNF